MPNESHIAAAASHNSDASHQKLNKVAVIRYNCILHKLNIVLDNYEPPDKHLVRLGQKEL